MTGAGDRTNKVRERERLRKAAWREMNRMYYNNYMKLLMRRLRAGKKWKSESPSS